MTTIDLTDRYHIARYMRGGLAVWTLDRGDFPVEAGILHHSAGTYGGVVLDADSPETVERDQLDALARDHYARFGIAIGYHYVLFPSGRLYAVGKWGTQRAHVKGRNPITTQRWNIDAIGIVAFGDFEKEAAGEALREAIESAVAEVRDIAGERVPVHGHGLTPTVNSAGVKYRQGTMCPGRNLLPMVGRLNAQTETDWTDTLAHIETARDELDAVEAALLAS
ncbi:hypothetical protein LCGC14_1551090 [marine sediment metagenome]|uniref:N-acetylmuramoyl-L-alanine amidase domain-containing protein n=1 Tax=marine sediment metagenome TaxID=412755 RepID=A0A0F9L693_9ZZZZ